MPRKGQGEPKHKIHAMKTANIKIELEPGATMPVRATAHAVGYDVTSIRMFAVSDTGEKRPCYNRQDLVDLETDEFPCSYVEVHTGVHVQPEPPYYVQLHPCSRIAPLSVIYGNGLGNIDPDFTGGMRIILNSVREYWKIDDIAQFLPGNVAGQLIISEFIGANWHQVKTLDPTVRGAGGFGSTDPYRKHI